MNEIIIYIFYILLLIYLILKNKVYKKISNNMQYEAKKSPLNDREKYSNIQPHNIPHSVQNSVQNSVHSAECADAQCTECADAQCADITYLYDSLSSPVDRGMANVMSAVSKRSKNSLTNASRLTKNSIHKYFGDELEQNENAEWWYNNEYEINL